MRERGDVWSASYRVFSVAASAACRDARNSSRGRNPAADRPGGPHRGGRKAPPAHAGQLAGLYEKLRNMAIGWADRIAWEIRVTGIFSPRAAHTPLDKAEGPSYLLRRKLLALGFDEC